MSTPNSQNIEQLSEQDLALISACLDNQLTAEELTAFKKRLLQEPTLNAQYQQFKKMDEQIKQHITSIDNTPVPQEISELLDTQTSNQPQQKTVTTRIFALAATIAAVGILSYQAFTPQNSQPIDIASTNSTNSGQQTLNPQVHDTLSQNPSMNIKILDDQSKMVVLQSFYNNQGQPCREYQLANSKQTQHAIACYNDKTWANVVNTFKNKQAGGQYQTASAQNPDQIINYLNKVKEQNIINQQQESHLIDSKWLLTEN